MNNELIKYYNEIIADKKCDVLLCEYCIDAIRSRGESVYNGGEAIDIDEAEDNGIVCDWCEEFDTLYACIW